MLLRRHTLHLFNILRPVAKDCHPNKRARSNLRQSIISHTPKPHRYGAVTRHTPSTPADQQQPVTFESLLLLPVLLLLLPLLLLLVAYVCRATNQCDSGTVDRVPELAGRSRHHLHRHSPHHRFAPWIRQRVTLSRLPHLKGAPRTVLILTPTPPEVRHPPA
ncbi:hypothetical protein Vretimale_15944 [Volvox reticuliferus]|uniref:Uncharacterized protein n=1 Tax=Volvox reticuliferus TaxID=1737510 RepID=A0A8J4GRT3_9CHLO|nr:hypothetical protein Vretifemale_13005 [Volvox reticuliferus]GIM12630.1 hypothetical protein Vretimale_15944 [Volvox reticuliferus]